MNYLGYFQKGGPIQQPQSPEDMAALMFSVLDSIGIDKETAMQKLDAIGQSGDEETMNSIGAAVQVILETQNNPTEETQQAVEYLTKTLGSEMFKKGGKLFCLAERFKKGGKAACGCNGGKVKKGQEGLNTKYNSAKAAAYAKKHLSSGDIMKIQQFLSTYNGTGNRSSVGEGYYKGDLNGQWSDELGRAIAAYQRRFGDVDDGMWGSRTNNNHRVLTRTWGTGESTPIEVANQRRDYVPVKNIVTSETDIEPAVITAPTPSIKPAVVTATRKPKTRPFNSAGAYTRWLIEQNRIRRSEKGSKIESARRGNNLGEGDKRIITQKDTVDYYHLPNGNEVMSIHPTNGEVPTYRESSLYGTRTYSENPWLERQIGIFAKPLQWLGFAAEKMTPEQKERYESARIATFGK